LSSDFTRHFLVFKFMLQP